MTGNDDPTLTALQRLAAHAPDGAWEPDAPAVMRRGRVLRARRTAGAAATGALVLALAIGVPAGLARHTGPEPVGLPTTTVTTANPTTPAPSTPTSVPTGALGGVPPTTEVAADPYGFVFALNKPTASATAVTANVADELRVTVSPTGSSSVTVAFDASAGHGTSSSVAVTWTPNDTASDYSGAHLYPAPAFSAPVQGTSMWYSYLIGTVPSWISDPTVALYSDHGWPLPDGTTTHAATVPTFQAPTADGRRMFVLVVIGPGNLASAFLSERQHAIAFDGAEGMYLPGCADQTDPGACVSLPWAQWGTQQRVQFVDWPAKH